MGVNGDSLADVNGLLAHGLARHRAGALTEAADAYTAVLRQAPDHGQTLRLLAAALLGGAGSPQQAVALLAQAALNGQDNHTPAVLWPEVWLDLAQALDAAGAPLERQVVACRGALVTAPAHPGALARLGGLMERLGRPRDALAGYRRLAVVEPERLDALILASDLARSLQQFETVEEITGWLVRRLGRDVAVDWRPLSSLLYRDLFMPLPSTLLDRLARQVDQGLASEAVAAPPLPPAVPRAWGHGRRLRIGYASANFGDHPIGQVMQSLVEAHDRGRFEIHGFSRRNRLDEPASYARRLAAGFDHFHSVEGLTPDALAARVRTLGIDILVEIDGHMDKRGLEVLARRPAPLQVFWLGHAGGLGLSSVDYLVADRVVLPPGEEGRYREQVVRLPEVYHCADRHPIAADAGRRSDWGLPEEAVVFCGFNNVEKITAPVFAAWMRLLRRVKGSVLWLSTSERARDRVTHLRRLAAGFGVAPQQLICAERVTDKSLHLARQRHADLFLDTLVINASTTALDALWAGLPVLTVAGGRFPSRIAATMLAAIGLDDLVCPTLAAYEERAAALAADAESRAALAARLTANRLDHPLFDVHRFARHLEAAYAGMWARHAAGVPPAGFNVPALPRQEE